ncbi:hypothetical protein KKG22_03775 [Patescibacteria group bacterium]|nr:hypothetical protein [Patescibacteria group bacterium]MBU1721266.1 hypothetical protein [Patescibacteria group bacterium]MBU1901026.1 hypothetical protein [Patescibacteria group bacterium]
MKHLSPLYQLSLGLLCVLACFFYPQDTQALSITPARQTAIVDASGATIVPLFITNNTTKSIVVLPTVEAFTIEDTTQTILWNKTDPAISWVTTPVKKSQLDPGESIQVNFTVTIPSSTPPGAHYLGLFAQEFSYDGQVAVNSRVASLFFLHVAGPVYETVQLEEINTPHISFTKNTQLNIRLNNIGNMHVFPTIDIKQRSLGSKQELVFEETHIPFLAKTQKNSIYTIPLTWKDIGKNTLALDIEYGATNKHITRNISLWYLPIPFISVFIIIFISILLFFIKKTRSS